MKMKEKQKIGTKLYFIMFCFFLTVGILSVDVMAAEENKAGQSAAKLVDQGNCKDGGIYTPDLGDLTWSFWDTGELIITGNGQMASYPESELYNRAWAKYADRIQKITVESGVTSLGACAFADLENLSSVSLPETLESIGPAQFWGDINLEEVLIPASVIEIEESIFISAGKLDLKSEGYSENVVMKGYKGSYAETYAKEHNIKFITVEEMDANEIPVTNIGNPRIVEDFSMEAGQKVTWDCVWFGNYPQSEVTSSDAIYEELQNATEWDVNNDITIDGSRYRRMRAGDAVYAATGEELCYDWSDSTTYHYFKYEPIKWRVLNVSGEQAILLADIVLDNQKYNLNHIKLSWENSSIRSWLNGYGAEYNEPNQDYTNKNFINFAFSDEEKRAICLTDINNYGIHNLEDKIFLLDTTDIYDTERAKSYGFVEDNIVKDEARQSKSSTYAKAMGVMSAVDTEYMGSCAWWLRSAYAISGDAVISYVLDSGIMYLQGSSIDNYVIGVRPALQLDLSDTELYSYAGTVCSDGTGDEVAQIQSDFKDVQEKENDSKFSPIRKLFKTSLKFIQSLTEWVQDKLD